MIIGTVTGHIHSTISHPFYQAKKLLIVDREDAIGPADRRLPDCPGHR